MAQIKGVSISLDLNTADFKAKLEDITRNANKSAKELKELEKALKVDPNNTELVEDYNNTLKKMKEYTTDAKNELQKFWAESKNSGADITNQNMVALNKEIKIMDDRLKGAKDSWEDLGEEVEDTTEEAEGWLDVFKGNMLSSIVQGGLSVVTDILQTQISLAKELVSAYAEFLMEGVEYNAQMQTYSVSLSAMLGGDKETADNLIASMKKLASYSGLSTDALVSANRSLIATGISAEESEKVITSLGNAIVYAGGGNDELERMASNLQQIKNAGKSTAMDLRQFAYAGVDIWGIMANYTGKTREELAQMQSDGQITYEIIANSLVKASELGNIYYGAMERNATTYNGQLGAIKTNFEELRATISEGLFNGLSDGFLPALNEGLIAIKEAIESGDMSAVKDVISSLINSLAENVMEWLPDLIQFTTDLLDAIVTAVVENKEALQPLVVKMVSAIKSFGTIFESSFWDLGLACAEAFVDGLTYDGYFEDVGNSLKSSFSYGGGGVMHSGDIGFYSGGLMSGGLTVNSTINVTNNGQPIDTATIRAWGSEITDVVTQELARRV